MQGFDKLTVSAREDNPSDLGPCWGGKQDPPTCSRPKGARTGAERGVPTCSHARPLPAKMPPPGREGSGSCLQVLQGFPLTLWRHLLDQFQESHQLCDLAVLPCR